MAGPYNRFPGYDASYQIDPAALALVQIDNPTTLPAPVQAHASGAYTLTLDPTQLVWCEASATLTLPTPTASWTYRIVVQVVTGGNAVTVPTVPWRGGVVPKLADADPWLIQRLQFDWDGTAWTGSWTALDVDYPIDAIAGKPAAVQVGAGTTGALAGFTQYGPRSVYVAVQSIGVGDGSFTNAVNLQGGNGFLRVSLSGTTTNNWRSVAAAIDGNSPGWNYLAPMGIWAGACIVNDGLTEQTTIIDKNIHVRSDMTPASGMGVLPTLTLASLSGVFVGLIAAAYPAVHTDYQRTVIMQKLTRMAA